MVSKYDLGQLWVSGIWLDHDTKHLNESKGSIEHNLYKTLEE